MTKSNLEDNNIIGENKARQQLFLIKFQLLVVPPVLFFIIHLLTSTLLFFFSFFFFFPFFLLKKKLGGEVWILLSSHVELSITCSHLLYIKTLFPKPPFNLSVPFCWIILTSNPISCTRIINTIIKLILDYLTVQSRAQFDIVSTFFW